MNDYITLDGLKYTTVAKNWNPVTIVPGTSRVNLDGNLDMTFGASTLLQWDGEIVGPVTARGAGWGTIINLRASLAKRQTFTFIDHYGTTYNGAHLLGPFPERPLHQKWDAPGNEFYVKVKILAKA